MDLDELRRCLAGHSAGRLAEELVHLAGRDQAVRRRLELLAMEGDSAGLATALLPASWPWRPVACRQLAPLLAKGCKIGVLMEET